MKSFPCRLFAIWLCAAYAFICKVCAQQQTASVDILTDALIHSTDEFYVSYTLDIANFYQSSNVNLSSPQLQYMAQQLSPAVLRIGGTEADYTYYFDNDETGECDQDLPTNYYCFTKYDLQMLMQFVSATNAKLVFGLSAGYPLYPNKNTKAWNSSNTQLFLNYIVEHGYGDNFYAFELGNELNKDVAPWFQVNAFMQLKTLLQQIYGAKNLSIPKMFGPDPHSYTLRATGSSWQWIEEFIYEACEVVDAFTYHSYVNQNSSALLTYDGINEQYKESNRFGTAVKQNCSSGHQKVYAGEIAEQNGGGKDGLTNRYEDVLWYLDAMGSVALLGQDGFFRQQIWGMQYHPNYALLNTLQYTPLPDYWIAVLFNRLMAPQVLNATASVTDLRVYAHCFNNDGETDGSVVLSFVSISSSSYAMKYDSGMLGDAHTDYLMSAGSGGLQSTQIYLNGQAIAMSNDGKIPELNGKSSTSNPITIEQYSVGFVHFNGSKLTVCQ